MTLQGPRIYTGVECVDRLIALFHATKLDQHVTSPQLDLARLPLAVSVKQKPPCVEIASPEGGDGKTHLLYYLITIAILPVSIGGLHLGGLQSAVLYVDCDGDFSITRLITIIKHHVTTCIRNSQREGLSSVTPSAADLTMTIEHALHHLHIFSPQSMAALVKTVDSIPTYVYNAGRHVSMHRRVHSVMLDSATAFHWADRSDTDTANIPSSVEEAGQRMRPKAESGYPKLRSSLSSLSQELACPIIYTTGNLFHKTLSGQTRALPSSLPKSWLSFPTLRLIMKRNEIRGFPMAISAEEAARDAKDRNEAVAQGSFTLVVNDEYSEEWSAEVRNEMYNTGSGRTTMRVSVDGVILGG